MKTAKSLGWIFILIGLWELASPFISGMIPEAASFWRIYATGLTLIICGGLTIVSPLLKTLKFTSLTSAILGLWLILSPFVLGYAEDATPMWNDVLAGMVTLTTGIWVFNAVDAESYKEEDDD